MKRITLAPSDIAWIVMVAGIVTYEVFAKDGELLSEASERYCTKHPWLARLFVSVTAAHLMHVIPPRWDPYHWESPWFTPLRAARDAVRARVTIR